MGENFRRVGSIIQRDKNTGVYGATLIYESEKTRLTFTKFFSEGGYEAAKRWSERYKLELPQYADRSSEVNLY